MLIAGVALLAGAAPATANTTAPANIPAPANTPTRAGAPVPGPYAPLDRPGPPLDVPAAALAASLSCSPGVTGAGRAPVLLVHGTLFNAQLNWSWTYQPALAAAGIPTCTVNLPGYAMADIATAGEYVVHAIRHMHALAGRKIDILGYSQGGMVPRWALRFWPDTRTMVDQFVAIDPSNHGTLDANGVCLLTCAPAIWQQQAGSRFLTALNDGPETFAGISYTVIYSRLDEVVVPNLDAEGSSALHTGAGSIANIAAQQVCPLDTSEHLLMGTVDPVAYALAVDAFTHDRVAAPGDIPTSVCSQHFLPGVTTASFLSHFAQIGVTVATVLATYPHTPSEPALPSYVYP